MTSQCRQNYHPDCEAGVNKQINLELYASYVYQSMVSKKDRSCWDVIQYIIISWFVKRRCLWWGWALRKIRRKSASNARWARRKLGHPWTCWKSVTVCCWQCWNVSISNDDASCVLHFGRFVVINSVRLFNPRVRVPYFYERTGEIYLKWRCKYSVRCHLSCCAWIQSFRYHVLISRTKRTQPAVSQNGGKALAWFQGPEVFIGRNSHTHKIVLVTNIYSRFLSGRDWTFFWSTNLTLYVLIFFRGNINIYLHFMSFLLTNKTQVVEIPPRVRQRPAYSTWSISWLLMSWRRKEPGHQLPWYWPS